MFNLVTILFMVLVVFYLPLFVLAQESFELAWEASYFGPESLSTPVDIAVDDENNAYVVGHTFSSGPRYDALIISYHQNGAENWTRIFRHPENLTRFHLT